MSNELDIDLRRVSLSEFQAEVELWELKGHENVVEVRFLDDSINLTVQDYVYPEVFLTVVTQVVEVL